MSGGHTVAGPQARLLQGIVRYGKGALIATVSSRAALQICCNPQEGHAFQKNPSAAMHPACLEDLWS